MCTHFQISMCYQHGVPIWFTWGPHIYIYYIYMMKSGWLGDGQNDVTLYNLNEC